MTVAVVRCDGGDAVGWGHVVRCLALASALRERAVACTFVMRSPSAPLAQRVREAGNVLLELAPGEDEVDATLRALHSSAACILVLDSYILGADYLDAVSERSSLEQPLTRIVLDDLADRVLPCEVVLNSNPGAEELDYATWGARLCLLGPAYALLRDEFRAAQRSERPELRECTEQDRDPYCPRVLVTLGGGRQGSRAVDLARAIDTLERPLAIDVLVGGGEQAALAALDEFGEAASHAVRVHVNPDNVSNLMACAFLAVSAAGTTCFELAASSLPAILLVAAENQRRVAEAWIARGVFELAGDLDQVSSEELALRVDAALERGTWLTESAARGRELVDGEGAGRVGDCLLGSPR